MTPASFDELLKEWEKEAKLEGIVMGKVVLEQGRKILSLIAVVRKQREGLQKCADNAGDTNLVCAIVEDQLNPKVLAHSDAERILNG